VTTGRYENADVFYSETVRLSEEPREGMRDVLLPEAVAREIFDRARRFIDEQVAALRGFKED
jgi:hypothetical protein